MLDSPVSVFLWQELPLVHLKVSHLYVFVNLQRKVFHLSSPPLSIEIASLFSRLYVLCL